MEKFGVILCLQQRNHSDVVVVVAATGDDDEAMPAQSLDCRGEESSPPGRAAEAWVVASVVRARVGGSRGEVASQTASQNHQHHHYSRPSGGKNSVV